MTIQITTNYDAFKFIEGNRSINEATVNRKKAMLIEKNLLDCFPIVVNEKMEIIEGQHRFIASKELGLPIYYIIKSGLSINDTQKINTNMKNWIIADYFDSYLSSNNENYIRLKKILDEYDLKLYEINTLLHADGTDYKYSFTGIFKSGKLIFGTEQEQKVKLFLEKYIIIKRYYRKINASFCKVIIALYKQNIIDFDRFIKKLSLVPSNYIRTTTDYKDNLKVIEEIYNYRQHSDSITRLYGK